MENNYHQFSFDRPVTKVEMRSTPIDKRSFYSQYDTDSRQLFINPSNSTIRKTPMSAYAPKNKAEGSPVANNNYSPDTHSFFLNNEVYIQLASKPSQDRLENKSKFKKKVLFFAIFSVLLSFAEFGAGIVCNSLCLMTDSLRLFYLFKAFLAPYLSIRMSEIPSNKTFTFGYERFSVITSLFLIFIQWGLIIGLIIDASKRWVLNGYEIGKEIMLITAFVGLLCNLILRRVLSSLKSQGSIQGIKDLQTTSPENANISCVFNKKSEPDDTIISEKKKEVLPNFMNPETLKKMKKTLELDTEYLEEQKINESQEDPFPAKESIILPSFSYSKPSSVRSENSYNDGDGNLKEIIKESLVDIFQHVSVIIAGSIIFFDSQLIFFDIIFTYVLGVFMVLASLKSVKENILVLMDAAPPELDVNIIGYNLRQIPEVNDLHNMHIWKISSEKFGFSVHLSAQKSQELLWKINIILSRMGFSFISIQIEEDNNYENRLICE